MAKQGLDSNTKAKTPLIINRLELSYWLYSTIRLTNYGYLNRQDAKWMLPATWTYNKHSKDPFFTFRFFL